MEQGTQLMIVGDVILTGIITENGLLTVQLGLDAMPLAVVMVDSMWSLTQVTMTQ